MTLRGKVNCPYYVDTVNNTVHYPGYAPGAEPALSDRPPVLVEGQKLVVYRELPITQEKNLGEKWPFNVIELALDKLTMILQQIFDWWGRTLKISAGNAANNVNTTVPLEAGKVIVGNSTETGFESADAMLLKNNEWDGKGHVIKNVGGPGSVNDAATKDYVDRILNGYSGEGERITVFDNVAQMKAADLVPSQTANTMGYADISDGKAAAYFIRAAKTGETLDDDNTILLDNGYVAERLKYIDNPTYARFLFPKTYLAEGWAYNGDRGDCEIVITPSGKVLMIDCSTSHQYDYIMSYLAAKGITKVDYFLLTHYHDDHYYNIYNLINQSVVDFSETKWYLPYVDSAPTSEGSQHLTVQGWLTGRDVTYLNSDRTIQLDADTSMYLFNCSDAARAYYHSIDDGTEIKGWNLYSVQALIYHKNVIAYYTGDLWFEGINYVSNNYDLPNVDLMKLNHHGWIAYSTDTSAYVRKLNPKYSTYNFIPNATFNSYNTNFTSTPILYWTQNCGETFSLADDAEFISDGRTLKKVSDNKKRVFANGNAANDIYIDKNYDYSKGFPIGSAERPFVSCNEAYYFMRNPGTRPTLHFASGEYSIALFDCFADIRCENDTTFSAIVVGNSNVRFIDTVHVGRIDFSNSKLSFHTLYLTPVGNVKASSIISSTLYIDYLYVNATDKTSSNDILDLFTSKIRCGEVSISNIKASANDYIALAGYTHIGITTLTLINIADYVFVGGGSGGAKMRVNSITLTNVTHKVSSNSNVSTINGFSYGTNPNSLLCNEGVQIYNTNLHKPLWWNDSSEVWIDGTGTPV